MAANTNHAFGYGDDPWTEEATRKVKEQFTHPCEPLFVFNGTGSNTMALQLMTRPYHVIFCADTAHIAVDECGTASAPAAAVVDITQRPEQDTFVGTVELNFTFCHCFSPSFVHNIS